MITIPIGNTVLFLSENEADDLREELETCCHAAELRGEGIIEIPDLLVASVADATSLIGHHEQAVNWGRNGF
jgi:predicted nucleic acid-binding protein